MSLSSSQIFAIVCVCRSFKLDGLIEVMQRFVTTFDYAELIWLMGDLSASEMLHHGIGNYVVNHAIAKGYILQMEASHILQLHENWRDWYQKEFRKNNQAEDLAELLFHEAACFKYRPSSKGKICNVLQNKTKEYLKFYVSQTASAIEEIGRYIIKLIKLLDSETLDRLEWIFPSQEEYTEYFDFLDNLCQLLSRKGYHALMIELNNYCA